MQRRLTVEAIQTRRFGIARHQQIVDDIVELIDRALASETEKSLLDRRSELSEETLRGPVITLKHGLDQDDFTQ
jgi:hypothetical protein